MIIFPAVDILDGSCVRLHQGRYDMVTEYASDPSEMALEWEDQGASWLHVVDLDGARDGRPTNLRAVAKIAKRSTVPIQYGGGVRTEVDLKALFDLGVSRVVMGTILITDQDFARAAIDKFGDRLVAGIDARDGRAAIAGWREDTDVKAVDLGVKLSTLGVSRIIYTDISVDGTSRGPNIDATKAMALETGIPVIASGGVASLKDIESLRPICPLGVEGVIVGRALYEKSFGLAEAIEVAKEKC